MNIVTVIGARPQFVKAAVVSKAIQENAPRGIRELLVHTGQHYDPDLSEVFFSQLNIPVPAINLEIGSAPNGAQTGRMLEALERVLEANSPDWVLVYGDTNSTLAAALAAAKLHIPIAHIESGLRSFNRRMPEEVNRVVTDHLSDLLFCPTEHAVRNLSREGISRGVHQVGDVMYDCTLTFLPVAQRRPSILARLQLKPKEYFLATIHRAENTDDPVRLKALLASLLEINTRLGPVVWPVHPRTRQAWPADDLGALRSLVLTPPLPYFDLQCLMADARCVLTDSGGMQKEAYFHRVPCLTLRDETEWLETVEHGCNKLVGTDSERIFAEAAAAKFPDQLLNVGLYGDGKAAQQIVEVLLAQ